MTIPTLPLWEIDPDSLASFDAGLEGRSSGSAWIKLRRAAEELAQLPAFDRLITLDMNRIDELPHQIRVAFQVLQPPMSGRAILADEVGLGKTIEAGIILKELRIRGLARRILVLTPASLVTQWVDELEDKFLEKFEPIEEPHQWKRATRAIASYDRARQKKHSAQLLRHKWDLVIVDEAHKCKNHNTARYKLIQEIQRNYLLLLTATPIQNDLRELYNLITLLRPGHLGTWKEFKRQYVADRGGREVRQVSALRELTSRVMIRTRRASVAHIMSLPPRRARHPDLWLTAAEADVYGDTARFLRDLYREGFRVPTLQESLQDRRKRKARTGRGIYFLECLRLAQRLCSSTPALASSLIKLSEGELIVPEFRLRARALAEQSRAVTTSAKLDQLTDLLTQSDEKLVIFSEHLPTVKMIQDRVKQVGRPSTALTGSLDRLQRHRVLRRFEDEPRAVLVSTRAGTEGLNLQFCHQLVNYELPWNPMVVEQRIGRVHRFGQRMEVQLYNYAARGTVEAHILRLLHTKIRLFELVVGELDLILERFEEKDKESFEGLLGALWLTAESDEAFERKIEELGDRVEKERSAAQEEELRSNNISPEDPAGHLKSNFTRLSIPDRLRLGYGTVHLEPAPGVEATRQRLGIHIIEILEMLAMQPIVEPGGTHPHLGVLCRVIGLTSRGREITLLAQADRLPLVILELAGDPFAPLAA
jgi:SNF2 family DNA or RNA helicase